MYTRLSRRNRTDKDMSVKLKGGVFDLMDNIFKLMYRLNDEEYDYIAENCSDDEIKLLCDENPNFTDKKQILTIMQNYITKLNLNSK